MNFQTWPDFIQRKSSLHKSIPAENSLLESTISYRISLYNWIGTYVYLHIHMHIYIYTFGCVCVCKMCSPTLLFGKLLIWRGSYTVVKVYGTTLKGWLVRGHDKPKSPSRWCIWNVRKLCAIIFSESSCSTASWKDFALFFKALPIHAFACFQQRNGKQVEVRIQPPTNWHDFSEIAVLLFVSWRKIPGENPRTTFTGGFELGKVAEECSAFSPLMHKAIS